jgi:ankyrin repeat protein
VRFITSFVKKLLELGVNPNARSDYGITPLMFAVNRPKSFLLIAAGADAKVKPVLVRRHLVGS